MLNIIKLLYPEYESFVSFDYSNEEIVMKLIGSDINSDKEIMLEAVKSNGFVLRYASDAICIETRF